MALVRPAGSAFQEPQEDKAYRTGEPRCLGRVVWSCNEMGCVGYSKKKGTRHGSGMLTSVIHTQKLKDAPRPSAQT